MLRSGWIGSLLNISSVNEPVDHWVQRADGSHFEVGYKGSSSGVYTGIALV